MMASRQLAKYGSYGASAADSRLRFSREDEVFTTANAHKIRLQFVDPVIVQDSIDLRNQDKRNYDGVWFNSSNRHEYIPFIVTSKESSDSDHCREGRKSCKFHSSWFLSQPEKFQKSVRAFLKKQYVSIALDDSLPIPHPLPHHDCLISYWIYKEYCNQFSYDRFLHIIQNQQDNGSSLGEVCLVPLSAMDQIELVKKARVGCLTGKTFQRHDLDDFSKTTIDCISKYCQANKMNGVFVKTMDKSAKNDNPMVPLFTPLEILQNLATSRDVLLTLEQKLTSHLILMPWNTHIQTCNEYRLFVHNKHLMAISQQKWYCNSTGITRDMAILVGKTAFGFISEIIKETDWPDMVIDAWIDYETERWSLIEINPGGIGMSSGSSLFEWIADREILHPNNYEKKDTDTTTKEVFVRIIDPFKNI